MKQLEIWCPSMGENSLECHIDPTHNDIVLNGYGITLRDAKTIREWFRKAIKKIDKQKLKRSKTKGKKCQ